MAGILWALETVTLSAALTHVAFPAAGALAFAAPFLSTFLHDLFSAAWIGSFNTLKGNPLGAFRALKTKGGKLIALAALVGGPVGMTGYVFAVSSLGSSLGAVASAIYPAVGAVLAYLVLKERLQWYRWVFLLFTLCGVYGLSFTPGVEPTNYLLGVVGALACSFGWGTEAVILAKGMTGGEVTHEHALQIRQSTSACVYAVVLLPFLLMNRNQLSAITLEKKLFCPACARGVVRRRLVPLLLPGDHVDRRGQGHGAERDLFRVGGNLHRIDLSGSRHAAPPADRLHGFSYCLRPAGRGQRQTKDRQLTHLPPAPCSCKSQSAAADTSRSSARA